MAYNPVSQPMRQSLCLVTALAALLLQPRIEAAQQALTGTLTGIVMDDQGGVLAGAQIALSSPALIAGPQLGTSDQRGQFRFQVLPLGIYRLDVGLPKFHAAHLDDIRILASVIVDQRVVLKLDGVSESVKVAPSRTETRDPIATHVGVERLETTPIGKSGLAPFLGSAPFVSPTSYGSSLVSADGAGVDQNRIVMDANNISATSNGVMRTDISVDFIQEAHVQPLAPSAEYGFFQGAVITVITKSGGNRLRWDTSYYTLPSFLTSQPFLLPIPDKGGATSGYERVQYRDATTSLGGPVARDRVWFFAGYQSFRDQDRQPGADPDWTKDYNQDKIFGKLTWRLSPSWQLVQSLHQEFWDNLELPTATKKKEATQKLQASIPAVTFGHLTHASAQRVWEFVAGRFAFSQDILRATGDPGVAGYFDRTTGISSGAPRQIGEVRQIRWTFKTMMGQYSPNVLGADHDWKIGAEFDHAQHRSLLVVPTGVRYQKNSATVTQQFASDPSNAAGLLRAGSAFATDTLTMRRLSITAGLRFDYSEAISPDIQQLDQSGNETGTLISGRANPLYIWSVLSPRVSASVQLTADGRTILRGGYGQFRQGILTGELSPVHPGTATVIRTNCDTSGILTREHCTSSPQTMNPATMVTIDSGTRSPRSEAASISLSQDVVSELSVSGVYIHKRGRDFIGYNDIGGKYFREDRLVPETDVTLPVDVLILPDTRLYRLGNQTDYFLTYDGVAAIVEKRRSRGWQMTASYTWSRARGLQPSSGTTADGAQVATVGAPPASFAPPVTFGQDPNTKTNATGLLPNDRPHLLRIVGTFDVPKTGVMVAANFQYASGKPWAKTTDLVPSQTQGTVRVLIEERGTRRLSSQSLLDLRVSRPFALGTVGRIDLRFDVLNALNDTAEESIQSDLYTSTGLGVGNTFLEPRRVMLSVRVNFGR